MDDLYFDTCMLNIVNVIYTVKDIVDFWLLNQHSLESRYHASDLDRAACCEI